MIARQTTGTFSVVNPYGWCTFYIVYRTYLGALATLDTHLSIYGKLLVMYHPLVKILANHIGIESGSRPLLQLLYAPLTIFYDADDVMQLVLSILYFPAFTILWISLHKWQTYITLGHNDREQGFCLQTYGLQILVQNRHGFTRIVPTGCQCPTIGVGFTRQGQLTNKISTDPRRLPPMSRETETYTLILLDGKLVAPLPDHIGNKHQFFSDGFSYLLSHPTCIACT